MPKLVCQIAALSSILLVGTIAWAQEPSAREKAGEHTRAGKKFQSLADYESAIAEYQAAYALVPHHQLLFNLGQAHRLAGKKRKALEFYEKFLSIEGEKSATGKKARGFANLLREAIANEPAPEPNPEPAPTPTPEPVSVPSPAPAVSPSPAVSNAASPAPAASGPALRTQARPQNSAPSLVGFNQRDLRLGLGAGPRFDEIGSGGGGVLAAALRWWAKGEDMSLMVDVGLRAELGVTEDEEDDEIFSEFYFAGLEVRPGIIMFEKVAISLGLAAGVSAYDQYDFEDSETFGGTVVMTPGFEVLLGNVSLSASYAINLPDFFHGPEFGISYAL